VTDRAPQPLWRNRDFLLLWSGQTISTLGTRISGLAYPLLVLAVTGSPAQAGLVGFAQTLPYLVWFLPAGALVDRWDRKRVMLVADAGRAPPFRAEFESDLLKAMLRSMSEPQPPPGFESRKVRDPRELRAFAHPVRLRILEELAVGGPATATELSERIGESAANCSWHLRQLAQFGYIEEAGGGAGRQRPWRVVPRVTSWGGPEEDDDPELARASDAAAEVLHDRDVEVFRAWNAAKRGEPADWHEASFVERSRAWLTAEELKAVGEEVGAIWLRYLERADPARRPPGARPIRLVAWGIPVRPLPEPESAQE
jgi:DNA-binding transcriptional ArsR family regulator